MHRLLVFTISLLSALGLPASASEKPNFVIIFTDDQGYGDLSCFGAKHVDTPRIDQMAAEGQRLTNFYVAAPVCTPSRAGLMTGCYPKRIDMATGSNFGVLLAGDSKGLNPEELTLAEVLKSAGYATGIFGKWHLGDQPEFLPTRQGFDEFFGIPYSHDIHPFHPNKKWNFPPLPLLEGEEVIEMEPDADYLTQRFTERAVDFIARHKDEPFFIYLPHPLPHSPLHVSPDFSEDIPKKLAEPLAQEPEGTVDYQLRSQLYGQTIKEIDSSVGQILDALDANGVGDNTFVIFFSDNGPGGSKLATAGPLRGRKGSTFEGGLRVPTVVRWPSGIKTLGENDELMTAMDLFPTFATLAGATIPKNRTIDGRDISPVLTNNAATPHEAFFYYSGNELAAVRSGDWKLHLKGSNPTALFDLATDLGEASNLIAENPEVTSRLLSLAKKFRENIAADHRPAAFVENPVPLSMK